MEHLDQYLDVGLKIIGGASVVAGFLRAILPGLRGYAERTATNADDALVEAFSVGVSLLTMLVEALHGAANAIAINPRKPRVIQNGKDMP